MIKVVVGNNLNRETVIVPPETTIRQVLEDKQIDYTVGMVTLDGATLQPGNMDKSFEDMGITERCFLLQIVKANNA